MAHEHHVSEDLRTTASDLTAHVVAGSHRINRRELGKLTSQESEWLARHLLSTLPTSTSGADEAARLRRLIAILAMLPAAPPHESVARLRARYLAAPRRTGIFAPLLDRLARLAQPPTIPPEATENEPQRTRTRLPRRGGRRNREPPAVVRLEAVAQRYFRVCIDDHDSAIPLTVGEQYTVALDIGDFAPASAPFPEHLFSADTGEEIELTLQVDSRDFEILGDNTRRLRVPRAGRSLGKARFDVRPLRDGPSQLTANVHYDGNFVSQLTITIICGGKRGGITITATGRSLAAITDLQPRDISLVLTAVPEGFICTAIGSVHNTVTLPVTVDQAAAAAERARRTLLSVVRTLHDDGHPFLDEIDIPPDVADDALRVLARAGATLFQSIFVAPGAGHDALSVGRWLREHALDPSIELKVQIVARHLPIPWSMLYLGDVSDHDRLDWNHFLGLRHVVEMLPLQDLTGTTNIKRIDSQPSLPVSLNINPTIDASMQQDLVERHRRRWDDLRSHCRLDVRTRHTRVDAVQALSGNDADDKLIYFLCHADGSSDDANSAALIMGTIGDKAEWATLEGLKLAAPPTEMLAARPLVVLNACDSANLSPKFYDGFVPYFLSRGARGVVGTEAKVPVVFAVRWGEAFIENLLGGTTVGTAVRRLRTEFLRDHGNPLGLLYATYCDADTRVDPPLTAVPDGTPTRLEQDPL